MASFQGLMRAASLRVVFALGRMIGIGRDRPRRRRGAAGFGELVLVPIGFKLVQANRGGVGFEPAFVVAQCLFHLRQTLDGFVNFKFPLTNLVVPKGVLAAPEQVFPMKFIGRHG